LPILVRDEKEISIVVRPVHPENALLPILVRDEKEISIVVRPVHP
jgi:hypothetical protein